MQVLSLCLPLFILMHNLIDFCPLTSFTDHSVSPSLDYPEQEASPNLVTEPTVNRTYLTQLNRVVTDWADQLEGRAGLHLINQSGSFKEAPHFISLQLEFHRELSLSAARALVLQTMADFLTTLNQSACLRPYLPRDLDLKDMAMSFNFASHSTYSYPLVNQIHHVNFSDGMITYYIADTSSVIYKLEKLRQESLAFAQKLTLVTANFSSFSMNDTKQCATR